MTMIRTYSELSRISDFEGRYRYLNLKGAVGRETFGFDRYVNQMFYRSREWKRIRHTVIARDLGCDLGVEGHEIYDKVLIHHMNPIVLSDIVDGLEEILDSEYLICTTQNTHNAIHFGDERLLPRPFVERSSGDTKLW